MTFRRDTEGTVVRVLDSATGAGRERLQGDERGMGEDAARATAESGATGRNGSADGRLGGEAPTGEDVRIRAVAGEELIDTVFAIGGYAFDASPATADRAERLRDLPYRAEHRFLLLEAGDVPLATAAAIPMTQSLRGTVLPMGGVAGVATHPHGRRSGYARRVLAALLVDMRDQGQVVSSLYPFRESFYGRLGWAGLTPARVVRFGPAALAPLLRADLPGEVAWLPIGDAAGFAAYRAFLEEIQPTRHGLAIRPPTSASQLRDQGKVWLVLARDPGGRVVGAMTYAVEGYAGQLRVDAFFASTSAGRYLLLGWLARHIDQVAAVAMTVGPDVFPETWLSDLEATVHSREPRAWHPTPMGRVVQVAGIGGLAVGPGRVVVDVDDPQAPWNAGAWVLASEGGRLVVTPAAGERPDCRLTIGGLSALVFTGADPADFPVRGWGDPNPAAQAALRALFPPALTYLHEDF